MTPTDALKGYEEIEGITGRPICLLEDASLLYSLDVVVRDTAHAEGIQHTNLCLWREHVMEWLRERGTRIYEATVMGFCIIYRGDEWHAHWAYEWFDSYDSALISAVKAIGGKG